MTKEQRKQEAIQHINAITEQYPKAIRNSIEHTKTYHAAENIVSYTADRTHVGYPEAREPKKPNVILVQTDSVSAAFDQAEGKTAILNFASYKYPGGMFLEGSNAQEECLCHQSWLYPVLYAFKDSYYAWNQQHTNHALYLDRMLYTPDIGFCKEEEKQTFREGQSVAALRDVITCAAPNYGSAHRQYGISMEENMEAVKKRMKLIKKAAEIQKVNTLILGAWGCGVFQQDPKLIAEAFQKTFATTTVTKLVYPIPDDRNFRVFEKTLKNVLI